MSKQEEIHYLRNMERVLGLNREVVRNALKSKPWNERSASRYFLDFGEILGLLPSPPARILDLGVGPGWTSIFLARCGYTVLGLDIAPDMVQTASENAPPELAVQFLSHDYELDLPELNFDAVLIYDALHHAVDEEVVIRNAFRALRDGGLFITAEPGPGHSKQPGTLEAMQKYRKTEKDMEFARQFPLMKKAGFVEVRQYLRLSELPVVPINQDAAVDQKALFSGLTINTTVVGLTSIVVAVKNCSRDR